MRKKYTSRNIENIQQYNKVMLSYNSDDDSVIFSYIFDDVDLKSVAPEYGFPEGRSLLYFTVQTYTAVTE